MTKLIELLSKKNSPQSVPDLVKSLKVNKTTVYRQLEKAINDGVVVEVDFGDGKKHYELSNKGHHHHIVCNNCGKTECVEVKADLESEQKNLEKKTKFNILAHSLEFFGLCPSCK